MKLSEIVVREAVITDLKAGERDEVVREMIAALAEAGVVREEQREGVAESVLDRERKGSTGFGKGVAVPHVKLETVEHVALAVGLSQRGVDFNSLDKQPVYTVFLLVSPSDNPEEHLKAMEVIFKNLSLDTFRRFLRQASSTQDVLTLLEEADNQQFTA